MQEVVRGDSGQEHVSLKEAKLRAGSREQVEGAACLYHKWNSHLQNASFLSCVALFSFFFPQYIFNFLLLSLRIKLPNQLWV